MRRAVRRPRRGPRLAELLEVIKPGHCWPRHLVDPADPELTRIRAELEARELARRSDRSDDLREGKP